MSEELRKLIKEVGDEIQPKLHAKPGHPKRIAHAHLYGMIRYLCNATYSEADPIKVRAVIEAIRLDPNGDEQAILTSAKEIRKKLISENKDGK